MNEHTLKVLEWDKIKAQIGQYTASSLGLKRVEALQPSSDLALIEHSLGEVEEARKLMAEYGPFPLGGLYDLGPYLDRVALGGFLQPSELLEVGDTLRAGRLIKQYLSRDVETSPRLARRGEQIPSFARIEEEILRCINNKGEVQDSASPELARLRSRLRILHQRMMDRLSAFLRNAEIRHFLQEPIITLRNGRYCLPVKAEARREIKGIVHDQSSSGATLFIEPQEVVDLGNEIREVQLAEAEEVERILRQIAQSLRSVLPDLRRALDLLGEIDFISAKALWAEEKEAVVPILDQEGCLALRGARHPLLPGPVVPIDVYLGGEFQGLLITGPNTGGKTVTLKTVGLLTLLTQAGVPIPAEPGSRVAIFHKVFADIGDEQSIEQSLSTFSAHIRNVVEILQEADARTLVLLDEIGAGTDPEEGSALAKGILVSLLERGSRVLATTHYGELKEFAFSHPGMLNASVEFDVETLQPTYRLRIGVPGSSKALIIAERLGMPREVLTKAQDFINPYRKPFEEVYRRLEEAQLKAEKREQEALRAWEEAEALRARYEKALADWYAQKEAKTEQILLKAQQLLRRVREEAEEILETLRKAQRESRETYQAQEKLKGLEREITELFPSEQPLAPLPHQEGILGEGKEPEVGDLVLVLPFRQKGLVRRKEGDKAEVQLGAVRMSVPLQNLRRIEREESVLKRTYSRATIIEAAMKKAMELPGELHLRTLRADEALEELAKYLDSACLAGIHSVRIVHGKGSGVLRRVVWDYLKEVPFVKSFRLAPEEEGGAGVTIVELEVPSS